MNEFLFLFQIISIVFFLLGALRLGKEALICLVIVQALMANLFVLKQISLFGLAVTPSDAYIVGTLFSLNLLQEFYGKAVAKKTTWICFFVLFFFLFLSQLHLYFIPHSSDQTQEAFQTILSPTPRILAASLAVFFSVQQLDVHFFHFLRVLFNGKYITLRTFLSLVVSQFVDTVAFSFLGLFGIAHSLVDVIVFSFTIKMITIILLVPFTTLCKKVYSHENSLLI